VLTVVSAFGKFFVKVVACGADEHFFLEPPTLAMGCVSGRAIAMWEPVFKKWVWC
jgi:hypothetical protein